MHHRRNPGDLPDDDDALARSSTRSGTGSPGRGSPGRRPRWRLPLAAAAVVAAVAITTAAIVTHGSGPAGSAAPDGLAATCADVPAATAIVLVDTNNGEQVSPAAGTVADSASASGATTASSDAPDLTVRMFFAPGTPPKADLCAVFSGRRPMSAGTGPHPPDGTPLGYLSIFGAASNSARYLWGAVGPDVVQLQVNAMVPPDPGTIDPGFTSGPMWVIDSGHGTPWSLPEAATTAWAALGGGWHGFAVQIPGNATAVDALALDRSGTPVQNRILDLSTGKTTDGPLPEPTGTIAPHPSARPTGGVGSSPDTAALTLRCCRGSAPTSRPTRRSG